MPLTKKNHNIVTSLQYRYNQQALNELIYQLTDDEEADYIDVCMEYQDESVIPGICTNPDCRTVYDSPGVEPDAKMCPCDVCNQDTVSSLFVVAGVL